MTEPTIIEGQAVEVTQGATSVALTTPPQPSAVARFDTPERDPLRAMGLMSTEDFAREVQVIKAGRDRMLQLQRELLRGPATDSAGKPVPGIDYDVIPGTKKPSLLQPGAEQLAMFHRLIPEHRQRLIITPGAGDWPEEVAVHTETFLHLGSLDGPIVGTAVASCSSYEDRYLHRSMERVCSKCGAAAIIKGKPEYAPRQNGRTGPVLPGYEGGGWTCWKNHKTNPGCGANFPDNDPVGSQAVGKAFIENPRGLINTITQMSAKRGLVGAIRHTLGISDLFTQDIEDQTPEQRATTAQQGNEVGGWDDGGDPGPGGAQRTAAPAQRAQPQPAPGGDPKALVFEGVIQEVDEGTRQTPTGRVFRLRVKVGASRHHFEFWDEAAVTMAKAGLQPDMRIKVVGVRHEEDYPDRGSKPKKKVVRDITEATTLSADGEVIELLGAAPAPAPAPQQAAPPPATDEDQPLPMGGEPGEEATVTGTIRLIEMRRTGRNVPYVFVEAVVDGEYVFQAAVMGHQAIDPNTDTLAFEVDDPVTITGKWNSKGNGIVASETDGIRLAGV